MVDVSFDLSNVPCEWLVVRSGNLFTPKSIKNTEGEVNLSVYRDYGVILKNSRDDNHNRVSEDTSNYKLVEPGDFVLNKMKCFQGSLGVSEYRGIVSPSYTVLKPKKTIHNKYFHYLLRSEPYRQMYESLSYGVRIGQWELHFHDFKEIPSLYPPLKEQKLISRYIDKKTEQIDRLVAKIQKKIELLKEQRTSLINQCVTKGLDPNVEMMDSGVEWIGEIPKHWKRIKISYLIDIRDGTHDTPSYVDYEGIPLVTQKDIYGGILNFQKTNRISNEDHELISKRSKVCRNDIIMSMIGSIGFPTVVETDVEFSIKNVCLFRTSVSKQSPYFIKHALESSAVSLQLDLGKGGGVQSFVSLDTLRNLKIFIPSLREQNEIVSELKTKLATLNQHIDGEQRRLNLLGEYRQSLISSVVTGKVRVTEDMI